MDYANVVEAEVRSSIMEKFPTGAIVEIFDYAARNELRLFESVLNLA